MTICEGCGRQIPLEAHERGCPRARTAITSGRPVRAGRVVRKAGTERVLVAEGEVDRSWKPEQYTNEDFVWWLLGRLVESPRSQAELFDLACLLPELAELAPGTIRAHVSAALLWLRRDGLAEPLTREGRSYTWRALT